MGTCPMAGPRLTTTLKLRAMFALFQNHATGMPVLDAESDFRRARRAHAVARVGRWLGRGSECRPARRPPRPAAPLRCALPPRVRGPALALAADRPGPPARRRAPADRAGQATRRLLRARRAPPRGGGARARAPGHRRPGYRRFRARLATERGQRLRG